MTPCGARIANVDDEGEAEAATLAALSPRALAV